MTHGKLIYLSSLKLESTLFKSSVISADNFSDASSGHHHAAVEGRGGYELFYFSAFHVLLQ